MALQRRDFLKNTGLAIAAGFLPFPFYGVDSSIAFDRPLRKSFAITNAHIISMDDSLGDIEEASLVIEDGEIKEIGQGIQIPGGLEIIDGSDHIVMPGLIDCHWHLWTSLLKSMAGNEEEEGYFPLTTRYSRSFSPETMEIATRYAAAEAIHSGITTVSDYNHNAQDPKFVIAGCRALSDSGMRAQVLYGSYRDKGPLDPTPFDEIQQVLQEVQREEKYSLLSLGLGSRGTEYPRIAEDWAKARELGMRIAIHAAQTPDKQGEIERLVKMELLGEDVNIIHANYITDEEIQSMAEAGCTVTMTPYTEMRIGFGLPQVNRLYKGGVNLALGVDSTALTGSASLFENMKMVQNLANAEAQSEFFMQPYEVLKMVTINGARALGIDHITGSLTPGKRADVIMLNRNDLNLSLGSKPRHLAVEAGKAHNVSFVAVDGKILKQNGKLVQVDLQNVITKAREAAAGMRPK